MKFSIIIPVYNTEEYLDACVLSVLNQTYGNYEIILIDDGSKDYSGTICDRYAKKYPDKVSVIHNENQGSLLSRVSGITNATGDVLLFLDSDDCLRRDALAVLENCFIENGCDLVFFNASTKSDFSKKFIEFPFSNFQLFEGESKKYIYELLLTSNKMNNIGLKAVKKEIIDFSCRYSDFSYVKHGEDLLQSISLLTNAQKILYVDETLYYYRQREGSIVHKFDIKRQDSIKAVHKEIEKYIDIWGMSEYKAKHYASEVRGWVETLFQLLNNKCNMASGTYRKVLNDLSIDDYFRNAYTNMDRTVLNRMQYKFANWLYKENYIIIHVVYWIRKLVIYTKVKCKKIVSSILEAIC